MPEPASKESEEEGDEGEALSDQDPEFDEDLKQFSLRLQQQSSMLSSARSTGRFPRLRPNVSAEWLLSI